MPLLAVLGAVLGYAVIRFGGVLAADRYVMSLALGLAAAVYFLRRRRRYELAPKLEGWLRWPLALLVVYSALPLAPLPLAALRALAPARAEMVASAGGEWAPLAAEPAQALLVWMTLAGCALTFLLAREMAWRLEQRRWLAVAPLVAIAALEAALGLAQFFSNQPSGGVAHGTYINRNHYSGLLEMALPFAVAYAAGSKLSATGAPRRQRWGPALRAGAALGAGALILAGIIYSLSRMGFTAAITGLAVAGVVLAARRMHHGDTKSTKIRWVVAVAAAGAVILFVFLPPDQLIARFAQLAATEEITADRRLEIWRQSLQVVAAYPVLGCGLGGYEAAFLKYKKVAPMNTIDYAHNDYLQGLAELGSAGFALCLLLAAGLLHRAARGAPAALAAAATGALAAIALHSFVDFNLYIPANAIAVAWIAGAGTA